MIGHVIGTCRYTTPAGTQQFIRKGQIDTGSHTRKVDMSITTFQVATFCYPMLNNSVQLKTRN